MKVVPLAIFAIVLMGFPSGAVQADEKGESLVKEVKEKLASFEAAVAEFTVQYSWEGVRYSQDFKTMKGKRGNSFAPSADPQTDPPDARALPFLVGQTLPY